MRTRAWSGSDVGRVRSNNEDSYLADADHNVFVVADGVGGKDAGEVASQTVVELTARVAEELYVMASGGNPTDDIPHRERVFDRLIEHLQQANRHIYEIGHQEPYHGGMATTVDVLVISEYAAYIAHVGDSRVYLIRDDAIFRITRDHTFAEHLREQATPQTPVVNEVLDRYTHVLTRSIGSRPHVEIDTFLVDTRPGDLFLLCSDGLTDYLGGADILNFARRLHGQDLVNALIAEAATQGGKDNITAVIVEILDEDTAPTRAATQMDTLRKIDFLEDIELFQGLEPVELLKVLRIATERTVGDSIHVLHRGAPVDSFYLIVEGQVDLLVNGQRLAQLGPGDHFGELALFGDTPRAADAVSCGPSYLLELPAEHFEDLLTEDPILGNKLLKKLLAYASRYIHAMTDEMQADVWRRQATRRGQSEG